MKQTTLNWLRGADYDIQTAESLLQSQRYIYVIFMCHLSVEKTLKAIISEISSSPPPRTHNLFRLLDLSHLHVPENHADIVARLNTMSIATRYPEDVTALAVEVTHEIAQAYLTQTQELLAWLKSNDTLQP